MLILLIMVASLFICAGITGIDMAQKAKADKFLLYGASIVLLAAGIFLVTIVLVVLGL